MSLLYEKDTIVAQTTPIGEGALGVIRLSGPDSPTIIDSLIQSKRKTSEYESHKMYLTRLRDPQSREELDQVMVVWMKAPHSFTGEDVIEIHGHGGQITISRIINSILHQGARMAEPGEFSKRAFLNQKIDLSQAEAIADLIHAQNENAANVALKQMGGYLEGYLKNLKVDLIEMLAMLEAGFDFIEEDVQLFDVEDGLKKLYAIRRSLKNLLDTFETGQLYKEGIKVALVGRPNVGKSSLLNVLLKEEKAIIHNEEGTTRDVIEGERRICGINFRFFDTAGIRETESHVEKEGIKRSLITAQKADLVLALFDRSQPLTHQDKQILSDCSNKRCIIIYSKNDLTPQWDQLEGVEDKEVCTLSINDEASIQAILNKISDSVLTNQKNDCNDYVLNNVRHYVQIDKSLNLLENIIQSLKDESMNEECLVEDIRNVIVHLNGITDPIDNEMVLDEIFSKFCIGK